MNEMFPVVGGPIGGKLEDLKILLRVFEMRLCSHSQIETETVETLVELLVPIII